MHRCSVPRVSLFKAFIGARKSPAFTSYGTFFADRGSILGHQMPTFGRWGNLPIYTTQVPFFKLANASQAQEEDAPVRPRGAHSSGSGGGGAHGRAARAAGRSAVHARAAPAAARAAARALRGAAGHAGGARRGARGQPRRLSGRAAGHVATVSAGACVSCAEHPE